MKQTICDYCGRVVNFPENREVVGDLGSDHLAVIEIRPIKLNSSQGNIVNPDLCIECITKTLRGKL